MVGRSLLEFVVQEKGRYAEDKVPTNLQQTIERMDKSPRAVLASMVFMVEETSLLAAVLNLSRGGGPIAPVFADRICELHAEMQRKTDSGLYHPCVEEAIVQAKFPNIVRDRFKAAWEYGTCGMKSKHLEDFHGHLQRAKCVF